jgi:sterol 3beta-glucosyltransferase
MRITMIAFGTRGDVQPAIALGKALKAEGHSVRLLAGANFKNWIEGHGLEAVASTINIQTIMESDLGRDWIESNNFITQLRILKKLTEQTGWQAMMEARMACRFADVIISSFTSDIYALSIAEKLGIRHISMPLQPPLFPTRNGAATMNAPLPERKSIINYLFGKLFLEPTSWQLSGELVNRFRTEVLNLPPQTYTQFLAAKRRLFTVQAYSRHLVPHAEDWPSTLRTTGFWFLEEQNKWEPPAELTAFLEAGDAPVSIGFGSMVGHRLEQVTRIVVDAVRPSYFRGGEELVTQNSVTRFTGSNRLPTNGSTRVWLLPCIMAVREQRRQACAPVCLQWLFRISATNLSGGSAFMRSAPDQNRSRAIN